MEPYVYEYAGTEFLVTSVAAPVVVNGKTLGMTGLDISLEKMNQRIDQFTFYDSGFAGLMSNTGMVLAHQNKELVGNNYFESEAMINHPALEQVRNAVATGETIIIEGMSGVLKKEVYRLFTPITMTDVDIPWSAFLAVPIDEVNQAARTMTQAIVAVSVGVTVALAVIIYIVANGIAKPIREAVQLGEAMAAGDFTRHVPEKYLKRKDEIGVLTNIFATLSSSLSTLIGQVQESTRTVLHSSQALDEAATSSASAANEVAGAIEEVARSAESQMQSAEESARSMEEMTSGVQTVAQSAANVMEAAHEMRNRSQAGQQVVANAVQQMERIQTETDQTSTVIDRLHAEAEKIGNIVSLITDISEQTNLLALNAAIEAARAGEQGRGFAVVAEEVRKLADETKQSSVEIQQLVEAIQLDSVQASQSMQKNIAEVKEGIERNKEVGQIFNELIKAIEEVVQEIEHLSSVSEEMSAVSEQIAAASQEIASSAETASGNTQQVAAAAEEQLASMEEMKQMANTLQRLAHNLDEMLQQFKVTN